MWTCKNCNEELEDQFGACWSCGSTRDGGEPSVGAEFAEAAEVAQAEQESFDTKISYDPSTICRFAEMMYGHANAVVVMHALLGGVVGGFLGWLIGDMARMQSTAAVAAVGGAVGLIFGIWLGESKAFWYRLAAQFALCQVEIERNTRRTASGRTRHSPKVAGAAQDPGR